MSLAMSSGSSSALSSGVEGLSERIDEKRLVFPEDLERGQRGGNAADLMLACDIMARLVEGIPRFPWGSAGGMGFCGRRGPLLLFFLCFLVSAGGLVFLRGFRCCSWCCTRRLLSPRRKLSFKWAKSKSISAQENNTVWSVCKKKSPLPHVGLEQI